MACCAEDFGKGVRYLQDVWRNFHASQVYRADALGIAASGLNWLSAFMFGWVFKHSPRSLLDNTPLRRLLERSLDFGNIDAAIESGALYALSITASGYFSGQSVSFFQGGRGGGNRKRTHRAGARHASVSITCSPPAPSPSSFRPSRSTASTSATARCASWRPYPPPSISGAERIMVVGAGRREDEKGRKRGDAYPPLAQIAGHALSSIFSTAFRSIWSAWSASTIPCRSSRRRCGRKPACHCAISRRW
ncbi:MAG: hypothetical protein M5R42_06290 [Rhodocyclaceae bacterium]|nr:hypothetical protein [Rhodocyclaceae bacterium]